MILPSLVPGYFLDINTQLALCLGFLLIHRTLAASMDQQPKLRSSLLSLIRFVILITNTYVHNEDELYVLHFILYRVTTGVNEKTYVYI